MNKLKATKGTKVPKLKVETRSEFNPKEGKLYVELVFTETSKIFNPRGKKTYKRFFSDKLPIDLKKYIDEYQELILEQEYGIETVKDTVKD